MGCERTFKAEATTNTKERMEHWHREGQQESEGVVEYSMREEVYESYQLGERQTNY